ncbi:MAG: HEAT repeat domain-containing protein [Myxococcaceae bacterium]
MATTLGCASSAWNATRERDTAEAYRAFLREHPHDEFADAARVALGDKEFEAASKQHTVLAYKRFLEEFPDTPKARAARGLLEGLRFNAAKDRGTAEAWRQFVRDHPEGAHRAEAERALAEAEFREAGPGAGSDALERLVREHPDDPRRADLEARLDETAFRRAAEEGAFALYDYLRQFPAGAWREDAHAALFRLRLEGLLFSGRIEGARRELSRSPLKSRLTGFDEALSHAAARASLQKATDLAVRRALVDHYLRSLEDLVKVLDAPDPLDRWQAAEELGQWVTVDALDPLIDAFRTARNPLVRQRAFESLAGIVRALPKRVAEYELAVRVEALRETASSPEVWVVLAALLDVSGRLEEAATEYQRAFSQQAPDPVVLRRWVEIRRGRGELFSAAVAARQLAVWATEAARDFEVPRNARISVIDVRQLCASAVNARHALEAIRQAKQGRTEFPEDLAQFELTATDAVRLTEARLKDAELALQTQNPNARTCGDDRVGERLTAALKERTEALRSLAARAPGKTAASVLAFTQQRDPSPAVRAVAASLSERVGGPR